MNVKLKSFVYGLSVGFAIMLTAVACDYSAINPVGQARDDSATQKEDTETPADTGTGVSTETCGNGIVEVNLGEECDDGINDGGAGECQPGCVVESESSCGNGIVEVNLGEECDDGINDGGEGECQPGCLVESESSCGNGIVEVDLGEECDDGINDGGEGECQPGCVIVSTSGCGNGVLDVELGEQCDDANTVANDGCSDSCSIECGFTCETSGTSCTANCAMLQALSCFVTQEALNICCANGVPEGWDEADCIAPWVSLAQLNSGTYFLQVDRVLDNAQAGFPSDALAEADYTPVTDGEEHILLFSSDGQTVSIDLDGIIGTLASEENNSRLYEIEDGLFAGGRLIVWIQDGELQGEYTVYGSGVPIVSSGRGYLIQGTVDFF